jgi:phenylalanyl-tRNA synthetase alpha subunit
MNQNKIWNNEPLKAEITKRKKKGKRIQVKKKLMKFLVEKLTNKLQKDTKEKDERKQRIKQSLKKREQTRIICSKYRRPLRKKGTLHEYEFCKKIVKYYES